MLLVENNTKFKFDDTTIQKIANHLSKKEIELLIVQNDEIQEINKNTRGIDATTDVLSFPLEAFEHAPLGSIVINMDKVIEASKEFSHSKEEEIALLFIHGSLHLLGFDHECDNGEMREKEEKIIKEFGLPRSLIVRTLEEK